MKICGKDMRRQDMTRFRNTGMITEVLIGLVREEEDKGKSEDDITNVVDNNAIDNDNNAKTIKPLTLTMQ